MAKKHRKVFRRQADRSWKELKPKAKKRESEAAKLAGMRMLIREAAKSGVAEAIEHCANFWSVSDGFKKYIDHQIATQAEALMAAVTIVLREELSPFRREIARAKRRLK